MTTWSKHSIGGVVAGEASVELVPKFQPATQKHGVLYSHGASAEGTDIIQQGAGQGSMMQLLAASGLNCISGDNGGKQTWGNPTARTAMTATYSRLQAMPGTRPGKVALIGVSMGGLCNLNWAAANPTKVSCIVATIPVINPNDVKVNNRAGYASLVDAAYGGAWLEATHGATSNPRTMAAAGKFAGIPMLFFYGLTDTTCVPAETEAFATAVGSNVTLVSMPSGHDMTSYSLVDQPRVAAFINQYA